MRSLTALLVVSACSSGGPSTFVADAAVRPDAADSGPRPDATECPTGLADAGFTSLADFPLASICAASAMGGGNGVFETTDACDGSILVQSAMGIDSGDFWLFDASTGALQAQGDGSNGDYTCTGVSAGFRFPAECFNHANWGWAGQRQICPDPGADTGG